MTYKETIEITEQALDLFPVKDFLKSGEDVEKVMSNIEQEITNHLDNYPALENFMFEHKNVFDEYDIFNEMMDYEFIRYCEKRFTEIKWGHEVRDIWWVAYGINT